MKEGFWSGYWKSLKPLDVEEPIDVWVHRPLAYLLARAFLPTPISPNLVTFGSIALGLVAGWLVTVAASPGTFVWAGVCVFLSAVFDCADGQLARMRQSSSLFGRMLDGSADLIVSVALIAGGAIVIYRKFDEPLWLGLLVLVLVAITAQTSSNHTVVYDHYKTVFLKLTYPGYGEAESYESAERRFREQRERPALTRLTWPLYLYYLKTQRDSVRGYDPYTVTDFASLGEYSPERAAVYREHAAASMRTFRSYFGFGSLVFSIAVAFAFGVPEYCLLFRLVVLNAAFYGPVRRAQREASRRAFAALEALPTPSN